MGLPKQVQAQIEKNESFEQEINNQNQSADEKSNEPVEKEPVQENKSEVDNDPRKESVDYWRDRCNVVLGKYNSEVRRLNDALAEKDRLIAELRKTPEQNDFVSKEDREEFGEYADVIDKAVREASQQSRQEIEHLKSIINDLQSNVSSKDEVSFYNELSKVIPDWSKINSSKEFNDWLVNIDYASGKSYGELIRDADASKDINRVVFIFKKFIGESGEHPVSNDVKSDKANNGLEASFLPEQTSSSVNASVSDGYMTRQDITDFYSDVRRGKYRGREDERVAMEQKIAQASKAGKII